MSKHLAKIVLVIIVFAGIAFMLSTANDTTMADPLNAEQVARGEKVYQRFCSYCHGKNLEGQADWRVRKADGKLPAPPHDETGHTWHHPDQLLFGIIKFGLVPPYGPADYESDMPAWGESLKDDDIWAVLSYIKSRWPADTQQYQRQMSIEAP